MYYKESKLEEYAEPISSTEEQQCKNAIDMVKDALVDYGYTIKTARSNYTSEGYAYYYELKKSDTSTVTILVQGSFANNTNIKRYSDVDVSVIYSTIMPLSFEKYFMNFKDDVFKALYSKFGSDVKRKNKSIRVNGNTYRKSIDVVPAFSLSSNIENGIQFITDDGDKIINYPIKQIHNENTKNKDTNYKFKKYVRIFKNIRMDMESSSISSAKEIGSFQIESLIWNVPDEVLTKYTTLGYGIEEIISYLVSNKHLIDSYYESNGIKKLCGDYVSKYYLEQFINDLNNYFKYEA